MLLFINFLQLGLADIIDIAVVGILFYMLYKWLRGTTAQNIVVGILLFYILWKLVALFHMDLLSEIFSQFLSVGVIALIVIFQPEIRKFFQFIGDNNPLNNILQKDNQQQYKENELEQIVRACTNMSASKTGALIVMTRENPLTDISLTGDSIDSKISRELIETIFFKNTPLHDGALIIRDRKMVAARCILPVSQNSNIPPHLGLRHRASIGITENTDCLTIIVSEQTGNISYCTEGVIHENIGEKGLRLLLNQEFTNTNPA